MKDQNESTEMEKAFLENLDQELRGLDFSYQRWLNNKIHHEHATNEQSKHLMILDKIKAIEDLKLKEMSITLYNLHVLRHGGKLEIDWKTY